MPRLRHNNTLLSWPDENQTIGLDVVEEPDEEPADITDLAPFLIDHYWDKAYFAEGQEGVPFAEIVYPDNFRVYRNGKCTSLARAHVALESGLNYSVRTALDHFERQQKEQEEFIEWTDDEEASHSQA